jgi:hypothetical protein
MGRRMDRHRHRHIPGAAQDAHLSLPSVLVRRVVRNQSPCLRDRMGGAQSLDLLDVGSRRPCRSCPANRTGTGADRCLPARRRRALGARLYAGKPPWSRRMVQRSHGLGPSAPGHRVGMAQSAEHRAPHRILRPDARRSCRWDARGFLSAASAWIPLAALHGCALLSGIGAKNSDLRHLRSLQQRSLRMLGTVRADPRTRTLLCDACDGKPHEPRRARRDRCDAADGGADNLRDMAARAHDVRRYRGRHGRALSLLHLPVSPRAGDARDGGGLRDARARARLLHEQARPRAVRRGRNHARHRRCLSRHRRRIRDDRRRRRRPDQVL